MNMPVYAAACKIFLHPQEVRGIRASGEAWTQDRAPTTDELRQICEHLDLQMRCYVILLSSSGMRPSEAIRLKWADVDLDRRRIRVRAETTKTRTPRTTFFSVEAAALLADWQQYYPQFCERKKAFTYGDVPIDHSLLFPLDYSNIRDKFSRALKKAGLDRRDPSTGRHELHPHALRKYFRTRLPQGGVGSDVASVLMGHRTGLNGAYLRLTLEELEDAYRRAEGALWVYREAPINTEELKRLKAENQELHERVEKISDTLGTLMRFYQREIDTRGTKTPSG